MLPDVFRPSDLVKEGLSVRHLATMLRRGEGSEAAARRLLRYQGSAAGYRRGVMTMLRRFMTA